MANVIISPNMQLPVPIVGVDPGPEYASDVNSCLTLVDQHDHSPGFGVQITPSGLNINSDLPINNSNLTLIRSSRYQPQATLLALPADIGCVYVSGVDLYFNDVSGNQVRITQSGAVAGTPGSISGLTSPASATYVSANETFVWQSDASTPANMDAGSYILRNITANSHGITLSPPSALSSDYTITLPALPGSGSAIMTVNSSGGIAAVLEPDNTTLQISSNLLQIIPQSITQGLLAPRATGSTVAVGGVAVSASSGVFTVLGSTPTPVTNLSVTITTTGRPVIVCLQDDGTGAPATISSQTPSSAATTSNIQLVRGSTVISANTFGVVNAPVSQQFAQVPASSITKTDIIAAGTYTYTVQVYSNAGGTTSGVSNAVLVAYEL